MTRIKSDSELSSSDKFFRLVERLKVGPHDLFWNLHHLWYWVDDKHPDGILKDVSDLAIAHHAQWQGVPKMFVDALVEQKFIDRGEGVLLIHDWDEHRSSAAAKRNGRRTDAARTPHGRHEEEKRESFLSAPSPSSPRPPSPSSPVSLSKERKEEDSAAKAAAFVSKRRVQKPIAYWGLLVDHIKRKWEYKKRPNGRFSPSDQDFSHLRKRALVYDSFELMALYDEFMNIEDAFYSKNGHAIWVFCKAVDALVDQRGWKERAERYRALELKPTTPEETENVKKINQTIAGMTIGKVNGTIDAERKELQRVGVA